MGLDTSSLWLICISISAPIAAVVGFAVQLRTVKQLHLENVKLQLEIESLRKSQEEAEHRIVIPTTDEVKEYGDVRFSRGWRGPCPGPDDESTINNPIFTAVLSFAFWFVLAAFLFYLLFDIYRFLSWLWSLF